VKLYTLLLISIVTILSTKAYADHAAISLDNGAPGPINTMSAVPSPKGGSTLSVFSQYISNNEISISDLERYATDDEDVHSTSHLLNISFNGAYAINDKLLIGFSLPYVERGNLIETAHHDEESDHHEDESNEEDGHHGDENDEELVVSQGDISGIGDASFFAQYRFLSNADENIHAAFIFGIKTPTGKTNHRSNEDELFETEHQPGTGSWDPLIGLSYSQSWGQLAMHTNMLYSISSDGSQDTRIGDFFNYNLAITYRFTRKSSSSFHQHDEEIGDHLHHDKVESIPGKYWDIILELNGDWRDKVKVGNDVEDHTGGNIVYLNPGFRYSLGQSLSANLSFGIPIVENLNGIQSEPNFRFLAGVNIAF
jgi:hypothetical protein